jgi:tripartite-type tricarboxylate transporter receptor subunit TctC
MKRRIFLQAAVGVGLLGAGMVIGAGMALASEFPGKPIKLVVPYKPGGGSDLSARVFTKYLAKYLKEKVIVTNISGAGGITGELEVKNSRPDAYTLLWQHQTLHMSYATGRAQYSYQALDAVASTVKAYSAVVVSKKSPYKDIHELLKAAKTNPGKIRWGVATGGTSHFAFMAVAVAANMKESDFHLIGQSGDKNRIISMMQGNMDVSAITLSAVRPYLDSGDMRLIGVMAEERSDAYPSLPTLAEQGVQAINRFDYTTWTPKGTPQDRIKVLADAWIKTAKDPECQKELKSGWMLPEFLEGKALDDFNRQQLEFFTMLAKKFNLYKAKD